MFRRVFTILAVLLAVCTGCSVPDASKAGLPKPSLPYYETKGKMLWVHLSEGRPHQIDCSHVGSAFVKTASETVTGQDGAQIEITYSVIYDSEASGLEVFMLKADGKHIPGRSLPNTGSTPSP